MWEQFDKGTLFYIVAETGQEPQTFTDFDTMKEYFEQPGTTGEKVVVRAQVLRKRVRVVTESEVE